MSNLNLLNCAKNGFKIVLVVLPHAMGFAQRHVQFIARTVLVQNGQVEQCFRVLNRFLGQEGILDTYRRNRFYEKPFKVRRRINFEKCKSVYDEDMSRKIALVLRKNRVDPWPGY